MRITSSAKDSPMEIHCCFGHPSLHNLQWMVHYLSGLHELDCEPCQLGKLHISHFAPRVESKASSPLSLVHTDVWGPSPVIRNLDINILSLL